MSRRKLSEKENAAANLPSRFQCKWCERKRLRRYFKMWKDLGRNSRLGEPMRERFAYIAVYCEECETKVGKELYHASKIRLNYHDLSRHRDSTLNERSVMGRQTRHKRERKVSGHQSTGFDLEFERLFTEGGADRFLAKGKEREG